MKYVINGASAQIGRIVTNKLLETISPSQLTLLTRNPAVLSEYSNKGVTVLLL